MSDTAIVVMSCVFIIAAFVMCWLSLAMASLESALTRVTRANLNNASIEVQTDSELTNLTRAKQLDRIHKIQRLITDRNASTSACAFYRIFANVLAGVLIACLAALYSREIWIAFIAGFVAALVIALISVLMRPRAVGSRDPMTIMLKHADMATFALNTVPFARAQSARNARRATKLEQDLSDDEELERLQLEQGKSALEWVLESNEFDAEVSEMLRNVLTLSETLTREIMVPRTDMICIDSTHSLENMMKLCSRSGYSRIPVIGNDVDDVLGIAYLKDAVRATVFNPNAKDRAVTSIMRDATFVPESKPVDDLFHEMQRTRQHVAMVVDEYGGIAGMVTIEDALEQIVGELEDEHDRTQHLEPEQLGERSWKLSARTPIAQLEELFELDLDEDTVDTLYGLLTKLLGRVPIVGSSATTHGLKLTAVDSAGRRKKVSTIVVEPVEVKSHDETDEQQTTHHDVASHDGEQ